MQLYFGTELKETVKTVTYKVRPTGFSICGQYYLPKCYKNHRNLVGLLILCFGEASANREAGELNLSIFRQTKRSTLRVTLNEVE